jgi:hypothetical protein
MVGLSFLITITGFLSLVIPIGWVANLIFLAGAFLIILARPKLLAGYLPAIKAVPGYDDPSGVLAPSQSRAEHNPHSAISKLNIRSFMIAVFWLLSISLFIYTLLKTIEPPHNYDTGLYHAQAIRWIESFRVVPGLGNLMFRLAINSVWMLPSALFSFSFTGIQSFHVLNGFFYILSMAFFLEKSARLLRREFALSNLVSLMLIFFSYRLLPQQLSSPGTDVPVYLLACIIFLLSLEKIESGVVDHIDIKLILIWLFAVIAIIIKLSAMPLLLLPLYFALRLYLSTRNHRVILMLLAISSVMVIPWFIRGVITSGYLVFPISAVDFFNVDWKIPIAYVRQNSEWITSWARAKSYDTQDVLAMSFTQWVPLWWRDQKIFDRLIMAALITASSIFVIYFAVQGIWTQKIPEQIKQYGMLILIAWLGVAYWFTIAPDVRFGYGILVLLLSLLFGIFIHILITRVDWSATLIIYASILGLFLVIFLGTARLIDESPITQRWLLPADYPAVDLLKKPMDSLTINMPAKGYQCWYAPLPCTDFNNLEVHPWGDQMQSGFYNQLSAPVSSPDP